jgi:hypothetical protein
MILDAPLIFSTALAALLGVAWWAINWRYSGVIETKDGIIALYKERLNGASPDQARDKIEGLQAEILALKSREWLPLTATTSTKLKLALKDISPTAVDVFVQDRDGIFLARSLLAALKDIGWQAKQNISMNPLPDGLTVWPENEMGRRMRDALASVLNVPVTLTEDQYVKRKNQIAIGIGFKVD